MNIAFTEKFKGAILTGNKVHTLRTDAEGYYQPGVALNMVLEHTQLFPDVFCEAKVVSVQVVEICYGGATPDEVLAPIIKVDGKALTDAEVLEFVQCDGFAGVSEFMEWFSKDCTKKLIHWTNKRY